MLEGTHWLSVDFRTSKNNFASVAEVIRRGSMSVDTRCKSRGLSVNPEARYTYSSLLANNDEIIFSQKNLNFTKRGENTPTHCSSSTAVFANMNFVFRATKSRLWVSPSKDGAECRTKNMFAKRRRKCSTHYSRFVAFSLFR